MNNVGVLEFVRGKLTEVKASFLIVPHEDEHNSEYISDFDSRLKFVSGFSGSNGVAIIGHTEAYLWTDGRYFSQAEMELDSKYWKLMKSGLADVPSTQVFLSQAIHDGGSVAVDPRLISVETAELYLSYFTPKNIKFELTFENWIDEIWNRPCLYEPISIHDIKFCAQPIQEKLRSLASEILKLKLSHFVLTSLYEICWLLNLRGLDIPYNPVFRSFLIIELENENQSSWKVNLFVNKAQISTEVGQYLLDNNITVRPYTEFYEYLEFLSKQEIEIGIDKKNCNYATKLKLTSDNAKAKIKMSSSPILLEKSIKNPTELEGMIKCHIEDGIALVELFNWLESTLAAANYNENALTEYQVAQKAKEFRSKRKFFVCESFESISATGANSAVIHYSPKQDGSATVKRDNIYMLDSGAQYYNGTTDVTRTFHFTQPTQYQKECYTRVLMGFIDLCSIHFPQGVTGSSLDVLARKWLWEIDVDYMHGTGHGVGYFLNVHEYPPYISQRTCKSQEIYPLKENMITSIEPGYYENGKFGIRIENLVYVAKAESNFLKFEQLTMAPIDVNLIEKSIMSHKQINYLNSYHQKVWETLGPELSESAKKWLQKATTPI